MAMVTCVECGKAVSSEAETCPHCGIKLKPDFFDRAKQQASTLMEKNIVSDKIETAVSSISSDNKIGGLKQLVKNKYVIGVAVAIVSIVLGITFIRGSGAPGCSDSNVQALVLEIAGDEVKNSILNEYIRTELGTDPRVQGSPKYEDWNELKDQNEKIRKIIEQVDKRFSEFKPNLSGIRTDDTNDQTQKCKCGATLTAANGNSLSISYVAQLTEDGQLYVEVYGLK